MMIDIGGWSDSSKRSMNEFKVKWINTFKFVRRDENGKLKFFVKGKVPVLHNEPKKFSLKTTLFITLEEETMHTLLNQGLPDTVIVKQTLNHNMFGRCVIRWDSIDPTDAVISIME